MRHFMAIIGWNDLIGDIKVFGPTNKLTALTPDLRGVLPDDAFSSVPCFTLNHWSVVLMFSILS